MTRASLIAPTLITQSYTRFIEHPISQPIDTRSAFFLFAKRQERKEEHCYKWRLARFATFTEDAQIVHCWKLIRSENITILNTYLSRVSFRNQAFALTSPRGTTAAIYPRCQRFWKNVGAAEDEGDERRRRDEWSFFVFFFFFFHFFQQERTFILHWAEIQAIHERWGYSGRKPPPPRPFPLHLRHSALRAHSQSPFRLPSHRNAFSLSPSDSPSRCLLIRISPCLNLPRPTSQIIPPIPHSFPHHRPNVEQDNNYTCTYNYICALL